MQSTNNIQNTVSSSMKEKTTINEVQQQFPKSRGEVAAQEQIRILNQAATNKVQQQFPKSRGEVAAQEQIRILNQALKM
jgi:outer membrane protein assembly factor BamD (BamD/ComL family)